MFTPGAERGAAPGRERGRGPDPGLCDLLEVRWLLSERTGFDVGDEPALEALSRRSAPGGSAANLGGIIDVATRELPALTTETIADGDQAAAPPAGPVDQDES